MKIVIFDMDGTLLNSKQDISATINYVRGAKNLDPIEEDLIAKLINSDGINLAKEFYGTQTFEKKDRELFEDHYYQNCLNNTKCYDGIVELLEDIKEKNIKVSVATNAYLPYAKKMLEHNKIYHYFDFIVGGSCVINPKPNPEMIFKILSDYKYKSELHPKPVLVGDSEKDILCAINAKIESIYVDWGFGSSLKSNNIAKKPAEILEIILNKL